MLEPYNFEHEEALMWKVYGYSDSQRAMVYCDLCRDEHEELYTASNNDTAKRILQS